MDILFELNSALERAPALTKKQTVKMLERLKNYPYEEGELGHLVRWACLSIEHIPRNTDVERAMDIARQDIRRVESVLKKHRGN